MTRRRHNRVFQPGLGMVEMLIALAISAMLLGSVALAFHASLNSVDENQKIASATQNARVVLNRMMTEARRAVDVECTAQRLRILPPADGSGLTLTEYEFIPATGIMWYRQTINGTQTSYPILTPDDGVQINGFNISYSYGQDYQGQLCTKVMTAWLDLQVGQNKFAVTTSISPRQNQEW